MDKYVRPESDPIRYADEWDSDKVREFLTGLFYADLDTEPFTITRAIPQGREESSPEYNAMVDAIVQWIGFDGRGNPEGRYLTYDSLCPLTKTLGYIRDRLRP